MQRTSSPSLSALAFAFAVGLGGCASSQHTGDSAPAAATTAAATTAANVVTAPPGPLNTLTAEEQAAGWQLLFDGKDTKGWRGFRSETFPEQSWKIVDGVLIHQKNAPNYHAGDIITDEQFDNFELKLSFRLTPRGNSGIKYLVDENIFHEREPHSGVSFEFQILDDQLHPDAKKGKNGDRTVGSLYDLIPAATDKIVHPVGEWNEARLVVDGNNIEHWLNGKKVVSFVRGSAELKALIAESKYKDVKGFGESAKGHLLLQDHNDEIAFCNIKLRKITAAPKTASR